MTKKRKIPKNFSFLVSAYRNGYTGAIMEGGSRSRKTWSAIDFLLYISTEFTGKVINIIRDTYVSFTTTIINDINKRFDQIGLHSPFEGIEKKKTFYLFKNKIQLIGADKIESFDGLTCDIAYYNEMINISKEFFDQQEMRTEMFWLGDFNPKVAESYIFDSVLTRPDVAHLVTSYLDNPFAPPAQVRKILSYNPWHPDDLQLPEDARRPHPHNIKNGTANKRKWLIYGMGVRTSPEGVVFPVWNKYKDLPEGERYRFFGIDWGGNDPTTLVEVNIYPQLMRIYIKEHLYQPQILNSKLIELVKKVNPQNDYVIVDSARKDKKFELQMAGFQVFGATKGEGSIIDGLDRMQEFGIFVHETSFNAHKEFNFYKWAVDKLTGKPLNIPEDKNNHIIDPVRYIVRFFKRVIMPG